MTSEACFADKGYFRGGILKSVDDIFYNWLFTLMTRMGDFDSVIVTSPPGTLTLFFSAAYDVAYGSGYFCNQISPQELI